MAMYPPLTPAGETVLLHLLLWPPALLYGYTHVCCKLLVAMQSKPSYMCNGYFLSFVNPMSTFFFGKCQVVRLKVRSHDLGLK